MTEYKQELDDDFLNKWHKLDFEKWSFKYANFLTRQSDTNHDATFYSKLIYSWLISSYILQFQLKVRVYSSRVIGFFQGSSVEEKLCL